MRSFKRGDKVLLKPEVAETYMLDPKIIYKISFATVDKICKDILDLDNYYTNIVLLNTQGRGDVTISPYGKAFCADDYIVHARKILFTEEMKDD